MERCLLERYRRDRRRLLDFILSASLAAEGRPPPGVANLSDVDLDVVSVDYVLEHVTSGGVLDLSEASRRYRDDSEFPIMISSNSGSIFFLNVEPALSGPPPPRIPPQVGSDVNNYQTSCSAEKSELSSGRNSAKSRNTNDMKCGDDMFSSYQLSKEITSLTFGLPVLVTDLSDDDMREAAYEMLLAAALFCGGHMYLCEEKPKERKSRFLMGLRSKKERVKTRTQSADWHYEILDIIRIQMEISEAMDACIKQGLMRLHSRSTPQQIDAPHITVELLSNIYKSDFAHENMYAHWQKRQANILEELLHCSVTLASKVEYESCRRFIAKLRNTIEGGFKMNLNQRAEILSNIRRFFSRLSHVPGKFGLPGESCYWTSSYHFNLRLYQKLLFSVFDILEDGQIVEELEKFLSLFRLTWSMLGITEGIHDVLYGVVLLQQYIGTGETMLLKGAFLQIQKTLSTEAGSRNEEAYMNSLLCYSGANEHDENLNLVHSVLLSVRAWCDNQLEDYHLHFSQNPEKFEITLNLAIILGLHFAVRHGESKVQFYMKISQTVVTSELLKGYIENSISCACKRIFDFLDSKSMVEGKHHLAVLADNFKLIADKELTTFTPRMCRLYPQAGIVSSLILHKSYGKQLMPFLESVSDLSENVRSVLSAADTLERCLACLFRFPCGENSSASFMSDFSPYKIGVICKPLLLQWVNVQHDNIMEWTERAILIEEWVPLSSQQRHAASIVEVFRIIEENIDQFFNFNLPMDIIHLRSLLIGIFQSLDTYLLRLVNKLVDKKHLYPSVPALTRYKEARNSFAKRKSIENMVLEECIFKQLNSLSISKLCVRLNTLHYIREQLDTLEESIKMLWKQVYPVKNQLLEVSDVGLETSIDAVDELFSIFDEIKRTSFDVTNILCDFIGAWVVFWDMRDLFLCSLYCESVENARLDIVIQQLDSVLNQICDLVIDSLRDQVILSICRASTEAYVWILLDGGPSRAFTEADISMLQEDLNTLKEFFIASGEGLPCDVVEKEAKLAQKVLDIYDLKTGTIIEMLMCASEHLSVESDPRRPEERLATNADTLLRILCHKKDREASKFLKKHYHLPKSTDYDETTGKDSMLKSPFISDIIRSKSSQWTEKSQRSLRTMKQRFQDAASEIKYSPW